MPWLLYPREKTLVPIDQAVGWAPELGWTFWRREKPISPTVIQTPNHPASSLVAIPSELHQLIMKKSKKAYSNL
jgi:hypothetical protein